MFVFLFATFHIFFAAVSYKTEVKFVEEAIQRLTEYKYDEPVSDRNQRFNDQTLLYYGISPERASAADVIQLAKIQSVASLLLCFLNLGMALILVLIFGSSIITLYQNRYSQANMLRAQ